MYEDSVVGKVLDDTTDLILYKKKVMHYKYSKHFHIIKLFYIF